MRERKRRKEKGREIEGAEREIDKKREKQSEE